jgi:hypothetical protein
MMSLPPRPLARTRLTLDVAARSPKAPGPADSGGQRAPVDRSPRFGSTGVERLPTMRHELIDGALWIASESLKHVG